MMNLSKQELKCILWVLDEKRNTMNDNVATMDTETFKTMVAEKEEITKIRNKIFESLQSAEQDADPIFGI